MKTDADLPEAQSWAQAIISALEAGCERIQVAGSVRRGKAKVGDIEIVAQPRMSKSGLFGTERQSDLDPLLEQLVQAGKLARTKDGPRFKQFRILTTRRRIMLDLFLADADNWGLILAIRTGPSDYSRLIVTQRCRQGYLDDMHRVDKGYVWRLLLPGSEPAKRTTIIDGQTYALVPVPEETDYFNLLQGGYVPPEKRR